MANVEYPRMNSTRQPPLYSASSEGTDWNKTLPSTELGVLNLEGCDVDLWEEKIRKAIPEGVWKDHERRRAEGEGNFLPNYDYFIAGARL